MWPWEHAVIGYVCYSLLVHLVRRRSPTGAETVVVVFGSIFPDLIDKPLAWEFGVFSSGYGIAHSVFFAVPFALVVLAGSAVLERSELGAAFATGYLLHLPADVLPHYVRSGRLPVERILWPRASAEATYPDGFFGTLRLALEGYAIEVTTWPPNPSVIAAGGLSMACLLLWVYDGMPGLREPTVLLWRLTGGLGG